MIFSTTAVRSLSSLLAFAMATITTPSGVGGATTMNRKLNKNSPTVTPTMKCRTATLYYPLATNNTLGSPHIYQAFPGMSPLGEGEEKICVPNSVACIGDTITEFNTLYADKGLTQQVALFVASSKVINVGLDVGVVSVSFGSIVYDDTKAELNFSGNAAVSGGTKECAMASGTMDFSNEGTNGYGSVAFHLAF